ncbi:MAG: prenyltransferase/squalene oxidase repeat-containing protein [Pirellulales bacterium]
MIRVTLIAAFVVAACLPRCVTADDTPELAARVERAVALIQASATRYTEERKCFSCHHQTLSALAVQNAAAAGWAADKPAVRQQSEFTIRYFAELRDKVAAGEGVLGGPYTAGYALAGLAADGWPADDVTAALVQYLLQRQQEDGRWKIQTHRPPLEDSDFTATALAVRGLRLYATAEQRQAIEERCIRALGWLADAEPQSTEDQTLRLLGLHWCRDITAATLEDQERRSRATLQAVERLLGEQRQDGGWGQTADSTSDAYATGQALFALSEAGGVAADRPEWARGKEWLLSSQLPDGSWLVTTRSKAIQEYFESGFPHDESQFISICGTCWAVMALSKDKAGNAPASSE